MKWKKEIKKQWKNEMKKKKHPSPLHLSPPVLISHFLSIARRRVESLLENLRKYKFSNVVCKRLILSSCLYYNGSTSNRTHVSKIRNAASNIFFLLNQLYLSLWSYRCFHFSFWYRGSWVMIFLKKVTFPWKSGWKTVRHFSFSISLQFETILPRISFRN